MAIVNAPLPAQHVPTDYPPIRSRVLQVLTLLTLAGALLTLYMALFYAGTDTRQGQVQRIIYVHVGSFSAASIAFLLTVIGGALYLRTRDLKWDRLALSSVEIGLPLATITFLTGATWARPIWGSWWPPDPKLNAVAIMWLMYAAYLTLRGAIDNPDRRARFAAVFGILCFVSVVYTYAVSRTRTDTLHPCLRGDCPGGQAVQGQPSMTPEMSATMGVASMWWVMLSLTLIWYRVRLENVAENVRVIKARLTQS